MTFGNEPMKLTTLFLLLLLAGVKTCLADLVAQRIDGNAITLVFTNNTPSACYYASDYIDEVPSVVEVSEPGGRIINFGSHASATGFTWHAIQPNESIHILINQPIAWECPDAVIHIPLFSSPCYQASLVEVPRFRYKELLNRMLAGEEWIRISGRPNPESCVRPERSGTVNTTFVEQARGGAETKPERAKD